MRILYYFRNLGTVMYTWQIQHIVREMAGCGCEIRIFNPVDYENTGAANSALLKEIRAERYDLFMTCHNEQLLFINTLKEIRKTGIPTLLFCPDNLLAPFNHEKIASLFELVWLTSAETEYLFRRWGCRTVFLPYAVNPDLLVPDYSRQEIDRVGFIGTPHSSRVYRINDLADHRIPVTVHTGRKDDAEKVFTAPASNYKKALLAYVRYPIGRKLLAASVVDKARKQRLHMDSAYLDLQEPVPFEDMAAVSCSYAMMLSFTEAKSTAVFEKPVPIVNLRHFEIPMSGALQFAAYSDELAGYFEDGKEIVMYKSRDETIDKAEFYLRPENAKLRLEMKMAARRRAADEHTWQRRFGVIFRELGIPMKA